MNYRHTQIGYTIIAALGAVICLITIEIRHGFLSWKLGFGLIHKKVPASDIIRATPIKITHFQGWGIHWTPGGWLYNVSGFQAVEFKLKDGKKLRLGTDEPEKLARGVNNLQGLTP